MKTTLSRSIKTIGCPFSTRLLKQACTCLGQPRDSRAAPGRLQGLDAAASGRYGDTLLRTYSRFQPFARWSVGIGSGQIEAISHGRASRGDRKRLEDIAPE
ncbi:MAG: hypothetical protein OXC54_00650 [Rhodospirillaceae bacterium]|nr:hypothetical protein [Rhodospirillaceae bacterium]MCY4309818.1 hypothetical protein [Rhodospirillaceae bacterium]